MKNVSRKARALTVALITFGSFVGGADAAIMVTIQEEGVNTRVTVSGSVDVSGLNGPPASSTVTSSLHSVVISSSIAQIQDPGATFHHYTGGVFSTSISGTPLVGGFSNFPASGGPTVVLGIHSDGQVLLPGGYASGTTLNDSYLALFTPSQHGLGVGDTVSTTWVSNAIPQSITFEVIEAVPEPSSAVMIALGLTLSCVLRRRHAGVVGKNFDKVEL